MYGTNGRQELAESTVDELWGYGGALPEPPWSATTRCSGWALRRRPPPQRSTTS